MDDLVKWKWMVLVVAMFYAGDALGVQCPSGQFVTATNPQVCASAGGSAPGGPAGGDLSGTYPNPTVFQAGGGIGNFQAGQLYLGLAPSGLAGVGDLFANDGINVGPTSESTGSPGAGNVVIDNAFTCSNIGGTPPLPCLNVNSTGSILPVFTLGAGPVMQFGSTTGLGLQMQSLSAVSIVVNATTIMTSSNQGITIPSGLGGSLKLTTGSVLTMTGGTLPTLTTCNGAGSSVTAGSTPNRGQFATQTAGCSTATVHFTQTMPQKMFCVCGDGNATITPVACSYDFASSSTTQAVFDFANAGASYKYDYVCE